MGGSFRSGSVVFALFATGAVASSGLAQETLFRNDDLPVSNANAAIQVGFVAGEVGAATFTLTPQQQADLLPMRIKRVQILWTSFAFQVLGQPQPAVAMESINVYRGGLNPPNLPQPVYFSDPPQLTDGFLNEFDISVDDVILNPPLSTFTVGLEFDRDTGAAYWQGNTLFRPSLVTDRTAPPVLRNPIFASGLGWRDFQTFGGTGDFVIRVVVEKAVVTPVGCNRADITEIGGSVAAPGVPDGQLTVDDIIVFVNFFGDATGCPGAGGTPCNPADITEIGGSTATPGTPDGQLTVDDIIVFVNLFGEGCG